MYSSLEHIAPDEIEARSFALIEAELGDRQLPQAEASVIKRVIHTTADFEYLDQLRFAPGAVAAGIAAIKRGAVLVTDTNMVLAGISQPALHKLGCEAFCFMADGEVSRMARAQQVTRARVAVDYASAQFAGSCRPLIFAVGNAPTALVRLHELISCGRLRPALVIGVPVGFVNVVQSKELLCTLTSTPWIAAMGRKGGSTVAAAICNALLYQAGGRG